ncbi:MAG: hypothetical protein E6F98_10885 [Actinobacteria bacterium]|nr:MAG: hypothetical protein E6F98_10885 [Actinomycetota bacterium]
MLWKETGFIRAKRRSAGALLLIGAIVLVWADSTLGLSTATRTTMETTTVATTTGLSTPTFESETAYLNGHRPSLKKAVRVTSALGFKRAVARAKAGQTIDVLGNVRIPGSFAGFNRVIRHGTVNVVFQPGAGFVGGDGAEPAVFINHSGGWRLWGGTVVNRSGGGLLFYSLPGPFTWTGFSVGQVACTGVSVYPVGGDINGLALKGMSGSGSQNLSCDSHEEKGTGLHAWNIADATGGIVRNSTFATDTLNQATGAAVEIETDRVSNVVVYARARNLGFALPNTSWAGYAAEQVAGNVIQLWGGSTIGPLDIRYMEGNGIEGRMLDTHGVYAGANLSQVTVEYGRATGPILQNPLLDKVAYETAGGLYLGDCLPLP